MRKTYWSWIHHSTAKFNVSYNHQGAYWHLTIINVQTLEAQDNKRATTPQSLESEHYEYNKNSLIKCFVYIGPVGYITLTMYCSSHKLLNTFDLFSHVTVIWYILRREKRTKNPWKDENPLEFYISKGEALGRTSSCPWCYFRVSRQPNRPNKRSTSSRSQIAQEQKASKIHGYKRKIRIKTYIGMMLGMKLLQAATESGYPQSWACLVRHADSLCCSALF